MILKRLKNIILEKIRSILFFSPIIRRFILIGSDLIILISSFYISLNLIQTQLTLFLTNKLILLTLVIIVSLSLNILNGLYRSLSGYFRSKLIYKLSQINFLNFSLIIIIGLFIVPILPNYRFWIIFWLINTFLQIVLRLILQDLILYVNKRNTVKIPNVLIYGAGSAGAQLYASINMSGSYKIKAFIDDDSSLWGRTLGSIKIISPQKIKDIKENIDYILIAIPSLKRNQKKEIINSLTKHRIKILEIPSIEEITLGKGQINTLRPIDLEDLLGRDQIEPSFELIGKKIKNSTIIVTGAGGSIGSELCRQIISLYPKKLIIFENSELALYSIEKELNENNNEFTEIITILGNATNEVLINELFQKYRIDIVFHAAAYKHVPLVEANPLEGLLNNIQSSYVICKVSKKYSPSNVILISSDKAVRPMNIMGASKRLSELIFKSFSINDINTCYSMVRFGNVIGSSGSVVPQFKKQIERGGPIEVTHPEIIRYFMTIYEACGLVLQTVELSSSGDIFLLDMGRPKKIIDLARDMVLLSGLEIKDHNNPNGDIEIITTGLRPGEKLYEELLIDGKSESTRNKLIFRASENFDIEVNLLSSVEKLLSYLQKRDLDKSLSILSTLVPEWKNSKIKKN